MNIASNRSDNSKLSIKGYKYSKLDIGDWLQIDNNNNYKSFKKQLQTGKLDKFIKEYKVCITTNYCRLQFSRLQEFIKEQGFQVSELRRAEIVEFLQQDNYILQLYCTE